MAAKRPRTPPRSRSPSPSLSPAPKAARTPASNARPLLCTLPPTCHPPQNPPTHLASAAELEAHYATYHAHVCEQRGCGCVFPEARLLELHQTECHDPIAALRKDRGEKIFACLVAACPKHFLTPKARRLHLIQAHGYPKEFFFAVTNKGVGGLLKRWGEGASMVRGTWKPRESADMNDDIDDDDGLDEDDAHPASVPSTSTSTAPTHARRASLKTFRLADGPLIEESDEDEDPPPRASSPLYNDHDDEPARHDAADHALAESMSTLALVPPAVRFGRGAKPGARSRRRNKQHAASEPGTAPMDVDAHAHDAADGAGHHDEPRRGRRRGAGRGQARQDADGDGTVHDAGEQQTQPRPQRPPMPPRGLGRRAGFMGRGRIAMGVGRGSRY